MTELCMARGVIDLPSSPRFSSPGVTEISAMNNARCPNCGTQAFEIVVCENCGDRRCDVVGVQADGKKCCGSLGGDALGAGEAYAPCKACKKGIYRKS